MMSIPCRLSRTAPRRAHFTLLELLVVIAVITILVGIVIGGVGIANRKAAEAKTRALLTQLEIAFDQYKQQVGYYPQWGRLTATSTEASWAPINQRFIRGSSTDMGMEAGSSVPPTVRGKYLLDVTLFTFNGSDTTEIKFTRDSTSTDTSDNNKVIYVGPEKELVDAFDNKIYYRCPGFQNKESYDLWSAGGDGKFGTTSGAPRTGNNGATDATDATTKDDITNWKRN